MLTRLSNYPFLKAAIEDISLASALAADREMASPFGEEFEMPVRHIGRPDMIRFDVGQIKLTARASPRHIVCLFHDAIEFILYESLHAIDEEIYKNGQNTIGLDAALSLCRTKGIEIPLLATVRMIQKHRGDAKHHAQVPHDAAFNRMTAEFRIITSRLIYERFAESLGTEVNLLGLLPYHVALLDSYRKYRTHDWNKALRFAIGALLHKHRSVMGRPDHFSGTILHNPERVIALLKQDIEAASHLAASAEALDSLKHLPHQLADLLKSNDIAGGAEAAARGYASIDAVLPALFDFKAAHCITNRLVQPKRLAIHGSMGWSRWQLGDTKRKEEAEKRLAELLKSRPNIVRSFGQPYYEEEEDNYRRWWEFAIFDGSRWQTFHITHVFALSLESGVLGDENVSGREREQTPELILSEFERAAASTT